jgi:hypothetical protein
MLINIYGYKNFELMVSHIGLDSDYMGDLIAELLSNGYCLVYETFGNEDDENYTND